MLSCNHCILPGYSPFDKIRPPVELPRPALQIVSMTGSISCIQHLDMSPEQCNQHIFAMLSCNHCILLGYSPFDKIRPPVELPRPALQIVPMTGSTSCIWHPDMSPDATPTHFPEAVCIAGGYVNWMYISWLVHFLVDTFPGWYFSWLILFPVCTFPGWHI